MKAVIPAAGKGARMRPLTSYMSKAMLPLGKKPVLQHIIEELKEVGINDIGVVVKSNDTKLVEYFKESKNVQFIFDDSFSGPGGAVLKAESFVGGDNFIVAFADAPLKGVGRSAYLESLLNLKREKEVAGTLAIYPINKKQVSSRGVVTIEEKDNVRNQAVTLSDIIEKPSTTPSNPWASACRYVLDSQIFNHLREIKADKDGEIQLTPAISQMIKKGNIVLGYPLADNVERYDTGNFEGYFEAFGAFSTLS